MNEENEEQQNEEDFGRQLRRDRVREEQESSLESEEEGAGQIAPPSDHTVIFVLAFLVAIFSDVADFLIVGAIPGVGDALDLATGTLLTFLFLGIGGRQKKWRSFMSIGAALFEFLPFGINDLVPTYVLEVVVTWYMVKKEERQAEEQLQEAA